MKVQQTTSTQAKNIVKGNHTKPQPVEKLPPLKKEINIPTYIHVTFWQRTCVNKCLYSLYRLLRTFFVSFWFYYGPFVALGLSFVFGFLLQEDTKIVAKDGSSMGGEY